MFRFILATPLIMHGLAHIGGFLASWTTNLMGFSEQPWMLSSEVSLQSSIGRVFGLIWLAAVIGCVGAGLGLLSHQEWWPTMAVVACATSLAAILPWWRTVPPGAWAGAAFDLLVIAVLLLPLKDQVLDLVR